MKVSARDIGMVTQKVAEVEATTDAEIVTIVAERSDNYNDVPLIWAALAALLALAVYAAFPDFYIGIIDRLSGGWQHEWTHRGLLTAALIAVTLKFVVTRYIVGWWPVRLFFTPGRTKTRRVRRRALELFRASTEQRTRGRNGVLIYLSLAEHRAELIADEAIAAKIAPEAWGDAMATMIDHLAVDEIGEGMCAAIVMAGTVLAEYFPHTGEDPNELPNRLITL
jgi:putative membrane protein